MKFLIPFLLLLSSLLAGDVIFRSNALISEDNQVPSNETEGTTSEESTQEGQKKKKRTLRKLERVIELDDPKEERKQEVLPIDNSESIYYINRMGDTFIHPKSVLDLRKVLNSPMDSSLYYGYEGKLEAPYIHPFRVPVDESLVYFSEDMEDPNPKSISVKVDGTSPKLKSFEIIGRSYTANSQVYYDGSSELQVIALDGESGVKSIRVLNEKKEVLLESDVLFEQAKEWKALFKLANLPAKQIIIEIEDNVTNIFQSELIPISIDTNPPKLEIKIDTASGNVVDSETDTCPLGARISVTAKDAESEVSEIQFRYPTTDWITYSSRLILKKPGIYKIEFRAKDFFGNTSMPEYFECKVYEP